MSLLLFPKRAGGAGPGPPPPAPTVESRTPDLSVRITWRPEQFTRCLNGDFATDTTGWSVSAGINAAGTSITRITSEAQTCGELVTEAVAGSGVNFDLGADRYYADPAVSSLYVARVWLKRMAGSRRAKVVLGSLGSADRAELVILDLSDQWREYAVRWRPSGHRTDAELAIMTGDAQALTVRIRGVLIYSPLPSQIENGDLLTDATGWSPAGSGTPTLARLTTSPFVAGGAYLRIDSTPQSGDIDGAQHLLGTRRFLAGRTYRARAAVRHISGNATPRLTLGVLQPDFGAAQLSLGPGWSWVSVDWTPATNRTGAAVRLDEGNAGPGVWDITQVEVYEALDDIPARMLDTVRGAMAAEPGGESPVGTIRGEVADPPGLYHPRNAASPLYGSVQPGVPILVRALHGGQLRGVAAGRISSFEPDPYGEVVSFAGDDGLAELQGEVARPFRSDLSYAQARREALSTVLGARQLGLTSAGPESSTFYDGTDGPTPLTGYLAALDAATGSLVEAQPSPYANVGWVYRTIDRASLTSSASAFSIADDSRGRLPGAGVSDDALVTQARVRWQGYERVLAPVHSIGGQVSLPWGTVAAAAGVGVVAIGADPLLYPTEVPYLRHTMEAFGSTQTPEPEVIFTVSRVIVVNRRGKVVRRQKLRARSLRWDEPVFPIVIPANESRELICDFLIPMEGPVVDITGANATVSLATEPGRVTITLSAGSVAGRVDGLAVLASPWLPLPEGAAFDRTGPGLVVHEPQGVDETYLVGPGQAQGLVEYLIWRHGQPRLRPVITDGLMPTRQLAVQIGSVMPLTVSRYRFAGVPTVVRGIRHRIVRPLPWHTDYALEELPAGTRTWFTLDGGASLGIDSDAVLAH